MDGCRIWIDMSELTTSNRNKCCIFVKYESEPTVLDVEKHVCRVLGLQEKKICLLNDGWLLLSSESSRVLCQNDTVSVVLNQENTVKDEDPSNTMDGVHALQSSTSPSVTAQETRGMIAIKENDLLHERQGQKRPKSFRVSPSFDISFTNAEDSTMEKDVRDGVHSTETDTKIQTEILNPSLGADNTDSESCTNSNPKSKRKRIRRKRNSKAHRTIVNGDKEPLCERDNKKVEVNNSTMPLPKDKKHIFFSDETEGNHIAPGSFQEPCVPPEVSTIGLAKLMALGGGKLPPVFERKKSSCGSSAKEKQATTECALKPVNLEEMPVKESVITFKVLKMVNYSPELSRDITAKVFSTDLVHHQLHLLILNGLEEFQQEKGKFTLDDETNEEEAKKEIVCLNWNEIIEPKQIS